MSANKTGSVTLTNNGNGNTKVLPENQGTINAAGHSPVIDYMPAAPKKPISGFYDIPELVPTKFWTSGNIIYLGAENEVGGGTEGSDIILGGNGNDVIFAGNGNDRIKGDSGDDTFVFSKCFAKTAVMDFTINDSIVLDDAYFKSLSGGITADNVRIVSGAANAKALDSDDYLIYDRQTGKLQYDADGSGAGQAEVVATIIGSINNISYVDFLVG